MINKESITMIIRLGDDSAGVTDVQISSGVSGGQKGPFWVGRKGPKSVGKKGPIKFKFTKLIENPDKTDGIISNLFAWIFSGLNLVALLRLLNTVSCLL